ncbi:hypothetical protein J4410_01370 [Candidatus Woesearchaeota archaeon]|nr:hypothetical protein [Candidatus Woesearchaeota archaeon]
MKKNLFLFILLLAIFVPLASAALDDRALQEKYERCIAECKPSFPMFRCLATCDIKQIILFYENHEPAETYNYDIKSIPAISFEELLASPITSEEMIADKVLATNKILFRTEGETTYAYIPTLRYDYMIKVSNGETTLPVYSKNALVGKLRTVITPPASEAKEGVVKVAVGNLFLQSTPRPFTWKEYAADLILDIRLHFLPPELKIDAHVTPLPSSLQEISALEEQIKLQEGPNVPLMMVTPEISGEKKAIGQTFVTIRMNEQSMSDEQANAVHVFVSHESLLEKEEVVIGKSDGGHYFRVNIPYGFFPALLYQGEKQSIENEEQKEPTSEEKRESTNNPSSLLIGIFVAIILALAIALFMKKNQQEKKKVTPRKKK